MDYPKDKHSAPEGNEPDLSGTYTAGDYITWKVDELMELIHGKIFKMSPGPRVNHQRVHSRLHLQMAANTKLADGCEIFQAPLDVYLVHPGEDWKETKNIVEPDLFIVRDPSKIHDRGCIGAPYFVVEVLSPGTRKKDASLKLELYQDYRVREYWMIAVEERMIMTYLLNEHGEYVPQKPVVEDVLSPRDFPEIKINLEELFKSLPEED